MRIGIVGSGYVGATAGDALVMQCVGREIVFVDKNSERAAAAADDIQHAVPFANPLEVRSGTYGDHAGCRRVVLCAGVGQKPGETGLRLLQRNAAVFRDIVPQVLQNAPEAVGCRDQSGRRDDAPHGAVCREPGGCFGAKSRFGKARRIRAIPQPIEPPSEAASQGRYR